MSAAALPTAEDYRACVTEPAQVAHTSRGPVEYAERGQGLPLLSLHGSPAAFENGLLSAEFARVNGFRVIAPSRPGYGGTALTTGRTPTEHADAMAALLDTLQLSTVCVLAFSGGGPCGYALAGRHPDRVCCLLAAEGIALPVPAPRGGRLGLRLTPVSTMAGWMLDRFPERMLSSLGAPPATDPQRQAANVALARGVITTATGWARLGDGYDNEAAQIAALEPLPLSSITAPTLIVHGRTDTRVPPSHAEHAHTSIGNAHLRWLEGGHFAFPFTPSAQRDAIAWLLAQHKN